MPDTEFRVDVEPDRSRVRVIPVGELDLATVDQVADQVHELREAGFVHVVLDLRGLEFMDSTGLRLVLGLDREAREAGHELTLIPGPPAVQHVFELAGVCERLAFAAA